jgi:hypothetical protein
MSWKREVSNLELWYSPRPTSSHKFFHNISMAFKSNAPIGMEARGIFVLLYAPTNAVVAERPMRKLRVECLVSISVPQAGDGAA